MNRKKALILLLEGALLIAVFGLLFARSQRALPRSQTNPTPAAELSQAAPAAVEPAAPVLAVEAPLWDWRIDVADPGPRAGIFSTLVTSSAGVHSIAYLDDQKDDIRLASDAGGGWAARSILDSSQSEGFYPSLAFDPQGGLHLSEFSIDQRRILYGSMDSGGGWTFETAVEDVEPQDTALVITAAGVPTIVFIDSQTNMLRFVSRGSQGWSSPQDIAPGGAQGVYAPAAAGPDGTLYAAFAGAEGGLWLAASREGSWSVEPVDPGAGAGLYPSLVVDRQGEPHISYYDREKNALMAAARVNGAWQSFVVDNQDGAGQYTSLAVDGQGYSHISYYAAGRHSLKYAWGRLDAWTVSTVDDQGQVGTWNSLALSPDGSPCISYYSETDQVLKIACASAMDPHVGLRALHRAGQTFLTWPERGEQQGERYAVYRSRAPITSANLPQAQRLARVGENSSRIWGNYSGFNGIWSPRLTDRMIIEDNARPLHTGTGALVWTLAAEDFGGAAAGDGYYAVSVLPADGGPELLLDGYALGPVKEALGDPLPVEISGSPGIHPGPGGHYYLQYMDLRRWNPTYHAPNSANQYYGFDVNEPGLSDALAYTYDYAVFEPTTGLCGGALPDPLPVMFFLHGARGNRYGNPDVYPYPYCAYGVYPIDQSETWYFGFAREHDYRSDAAFAPGDVIENFTERRVLRMLYDLERNPPGPAVDEQRIYLFGHSMGGTGALAFAQRYPNVFAAIYAGQPVTTFRVTAGVNESWPETAALRWGAQELNLPVAIQAPNGWADALQQYNGVGVFDWENLQSAFDPQALPDRSGGDFVPFGIDHGTIDDSVDYPSQGRPLYPLLAAAPRAWAGAVTTAEHQWSFFGWPLANLGKVNDVPFYGLRVVRDETVPGLSRLSGSPSGPVDSPTQYNQTLLWSASWNAWDGAPLDRPDEWQMSLCAAPAGSLECGGKTSLTVDITPRRVQAFHTVPGQTYRWENTSISSGQALATGTLLADQHGLVTIPAVQVSPEGNRLRLWKP